VMASAWAEECLNVVSIMTVDFGDGSVGSLLVG
jgi:hypothetical protein